MATLTQSGLPAGAVYVLQDNLCEVERGGQRHGLLVRTGVIPKSGVLSLTELRDSNYALLFRPLALVAQSRLSIDVGDRADFRRRLEHVVPPPVILLSAVATDLSVKLAWTHPADGFQGERVVAQAQAAGSPAWTDVAETRERQARTLVVMDLLSSTTYAFRVRQETVEGRTRGYSRSLSTTTGDGPEQDGSTNLQRGGSFEQEAW
ncbi:MAG: fibronectin type III domain-containing protein [bacterium]|nr:fibronectin type III domain-containing protein [bacterium]